MIMELQNRRLNSITGIVQISVSILLFLITLALLKDGVAHFAPALDNHYVDNGAVGGMGAGWLWAMISLNGSTVAATAVVLMNTGTISPVTTFGMIHGSRLGAGLFVLILGYIYSLRGQNRARSLNTGLQTLLVAQTVHFPAFIIGYFLLISGTLPEIASVSGAPTGLEKLLDMPADIVQGVIPAWLWLPTGFFGLLLSFSLFDRGMQLALHEDLFARLSPKIYKPLPLFWLGLIVTMITMSVSISLVLLVPLVARGKIQQRYTLPYIMGAGVSTFIDTFFVAALFNNGAAETVVLLVMVIVTVVALIFLVGFSRYERFIEACTTRMLENPLLLGAYMVSLFLVPLVMVVGGIAFGL